MQSKYIIIGLLALSVILTGCGPQPADEENDKKPFVVQTSRANDFSNMVTITKPGRVVGQQTITVNAHANGHVNNIRGVEGSFVAVGDPVVFLSDSVNHYYLQLDSSANALQNARLQYQQNMSSLNKTVADAESALAQAQTNYNLIYSGLQNTLKLKKISLDQAQTTETNQRSLIISQLRTEKSSLQNIVDDVLDTVDSFMGVTDEYVYETQDIAPYIGAKNGTQKNATETRFLQLLSAYNQLSGQVTTIDTNIIQRLTQLENLYDMADEVLNMAQEVLRNSVSSANVLSATQIATYASSVETLQTRLQTAQKTFITFANTTRNQIDTIGLSGLQGLQVSTETANINLQQAYLDAQQSLTTAQTNLDNAQRTYDNALENRRLQRDILQNNIDNTQISYQTALRNAGKLTISSPINGTIGEIMVDVGQEVSAGTPVLSVSSTNDQLVEVFVTHDEYQYVQIGDIAMMMYHNQPLTGEVVSISNVANANGQYNVTIYLDKPVDLVGSISSVRIPVEVQHPVVPVNIVQATQNNQGYIYIFQDGKPEQYEVALGHVRGDMIEVTSSLPAGINIITTDMSNFNPDEFIIEIK